MSINQLPLQSLFCFLLVEMPTVSHNNYSDLLIIFIIRCMFQDGHIEIFSSCFISFMNQKILLFIDCSTNQVIVWNFLFLKFFFVILRFFRICDKIKGSHFILWLRCVWQFFPISSILSSSIFQIIIISFQEMNIRIFLKIKIIFVYIEEFLHQNY